MKLYIDNWRWQGVPFYIRTGKMMPTKVTEIVCTLSLHLTAYLLQLMVAPYLISW